MWASAWVPAAVDFIPPFPSNRRFFRRVRNRRILSIFLGGNATSKLSPTNGDQFAFDFAGNAHTETLMSLLSKSLTQATPYLVAVHLHDWCPSSFPTSKISHMTENGCWLWVKDNCNHLSFACPRQRRRHFLVNNYSETCIRRTLEHSLRVSKHEVFTVYIKKISSTTLSSTKALVSFKTNLNKKRPLWKIDVTYSSGFSWCQSWHDLIAEKNDQIH